MLPDRAQPSDWMSTVEASLSKPANAGAAAVVEAHQARLWTRYSIAAARPGVHALQQGGGRVWRQLHAPGLPGDPALLGSMPLLGRSHGR